MNKLTSNYPEYISNPISVTEKSLKGLFANIGLAAAHFGLSLAAIAVYGLMVLISAIPVFVGGESYVFIPIVFAVLLSPVLIYVFTWLGLAQKRLSLAVSDDQKISFAEMFRHDARKIFGLIGLSIVTTLAVFGGFILLIIPGIALIIFFSYAPFIYIKEDIGVFDALGRSFRLVKESFVELIGIGSLFFAYNAFSTFIANIPLLGILFSIFLIPIDIFVAYLQDVTLGYRYQKAALVQAGQLARPEKADPMNYIMLAIAGGLVLFFLLLLVGVIIYLIANPEAARDFN